MGMILANVRGALEQLWANKLRSLLTVLGMVIAVSSTIVVVSAVRGFADYVADVLQGMGTNAMWVWSERPSGEAGRTLGPVERDLDDVEEAERRCTAVRSVSPVIRQIDVKVRHGREQATIALEGVSSEYHAIRKFYVRVGRPFAVIDVERAHHICILGGEVLRKLRADDSLVGQSIVVGGQRFRVVGLLEEKGSLLGN